MKVALDGRQRDVDDGVVQRGDEYSDDHGGESEPWVQVWALKQFRAGL